MINLTNLRFAWQTKDVINIKALNIKKANTCLLKDQVEVVKVHY